jgi:hypothetical protein
MEGRGSKGRRSRCLWSHDRLCGRVCVVVFFDRKVTWRVCFRSNRYRTQRRKVIWPKSDGLRHASLFFG